MEALRECARPGGCFPFPSGYNRCPPFKKWGPGDAWLWPFPCWSLGLEGLPPLTPPGQLSLRTLNWAQMLPPPGSLPWSTPSTCLVPEFRSVAQLCLTLCDPMNCSTAGFSVHHQLPELAQTHFHWVSDAIQPYHPLSSPSPPAFNLSQHQGLFQWISSLHQVAKVVEFQLQHHAFQWIFRTDLL